MVPAARQDPGPEDSWLCLAVTIPRILSEPRIPPAAPSAAGSPAGRPTAADPAVCPACASRCGPRPRSREPGGQKLHAAAPRPPPPPGWGPISSPAALPLRLLPATPCEPSPKLPAEAARAPGHRRGPYLASLAIFTKLKTSMQAAGPPERRGSDAPSQAASGSLRSPMAGGTSARPGAGAALAAAAAAAPGGGGCYPPPAASCVCTPSGAGPRPGARAGKLD